MNNTHIESNDDEIDLKKVVDFVKRQSNVLVATFTVTLLIALTYALSMPTLYKSKVSVLIGERIYFQQQPIENIDEIKYAFKDIKDISASLVKNTRIVELQATNESLETAQQTINLAVEKLILKHNELFSKKKSEFTELLKSVTSSTDNKREIINILDNASNSNKTRVTSSLNTTTLRYSGRFTQIVGVGFIVALSLALFLGLTKDLIEKHYNKLSATIATDKLT